MSQPPQVEIAPDNKYALESTKLEDELEKALKKAEKPTWTWLSTLNQPIVLWVLSTLAVGFLTFTYTNYKTCRVAQDRDAERLQEIAFELTGRSEKIQPLWHSALQGHTNLSDIDLAAIKDAIDPNKNFVLSKFRGKWPIEFKLDILRIAAAWNTDFPSPGNQSSPIDALLSLEESLEPTRQIFESIGSGTVSLEQLKRLVARLTQPEEPWMLVGALSAQSMDPGVCLTRGVWPIPSRERWKDLDFSGVFKKDK